MTSAIVTEPSFFARLWMALACLFRLPFDPAFAAEVARLRAGPVAPERLASGDAPRASERPAPKPLAQARSAAGGDESALVLLGALQREGRFVDFLQQDVLGFSDEEVGAVARVVHEGCRKALGPCMRIEPVREEAEGASVVLAEGFDAKSVKLTGNVQGTAPFRGVLRHRGWRAQDVHLPTAVGEYDARVLAPAEVEL